MVYKSPIDDFKYNLEMLEYNSFANSIDLFKDYDTETVISVVEQVAKFNEQEMVESNKKADREGLVYIKDGKEGPEVKTPDILNLFIKVLSIQDILVLVIQLSMVGAAHHLLWQC